MKTVITSITAKTERATHAPNAKVVVNVVDLFQSVTTTIIATARHASLGMDVQLRLSKATKVAIELGAL